MKKAKTILKNVFMVVVLAAFAAACSSDDDGGKTKVRYSLITSADMITSISFKNASGGNMSVALDAITTDWAKTVSVKPPFAASVNASFDNQSDAAATYTLSIYVNDEQVETTTGTVSAHITGSAALAHAVTE